MKWPKIDEIYLYYNYHWKQNLWMIIIYKKKLLWFNETVKNALKTKNLKIMQNRFIVLEKVYTMNHGKTHNPILSHYS